MLTNADANASRSISKNSASITDEKNSCLNEMFSPTNEDMDLNMDKMCVNQNNAIPKEMKKASIAKMSSKN